MDFRIADLNDLDTFADCNRMLFEDEEHRNSMDDAILRERMNGLKPKPTLRMYSLSKKNQ
jgi:hypothetical protein